MWSSKLTAVLGALRGSNGFLKIMLEIAYEYHPKAMIVAVKTMENVKVLLHGAFWERRSICTRRIVQNLNSLKI